MSFAFAKDQLKSFIQRIIKLEAEKQAIADDVKEVYLEAKGTGFDTKVMRRIIALIQMEKADIQEADALEDLYRQAVDLPSLKG